VPRGAATIRQGERLERLFRPGRQAKAKVIQLDRQTDAIRVSLAAVEEDPWAANSYNRGDIIAATVVRQENGILYLETRSGLIGIASPPLRGRLVRGQKVAAAVKTYSAEQHKLHLELVAPL
jgi:small subunit ribosomal protein S1